MTEAPLLTPLLPPAGADEPVAERLRQALAADPALEGRYALDADGGVIVLGAANARERRRWELHIKLRLEAESI
jgi:hypothetical protein